MDITAAMATREEMKIRNETQAEQQILLKIEAIVFAFTNIMAKHLKEEGKAKGRRKQWQHKNTSRPNTVEVVNTTKYRIVIEGGG